MGFCPNVDIEKNDLSECGHRKERFVQMWTFLICVISGGAVRLLE